MALRGFKDNPAYMTKVKDERIWESSKEFTLWLHFNSSSCISLELTFWTDLFIQLNGAM